MKHELDLLENATDSLAEALSRYEQGNAGDMKAYKFCVLHLAHFLELILKYHVTLAHPLLIYKNPFAKSFGEDSQTIGLEETINFLANEGKPLPEGFLSDLRWLKRLRNRIEHYKFDMNVEEVKDAVGRLIRAYVQFDDEFDDLAAGLLDDDRYEVFKMLASDYEQRLKTAKEQVEAASRGRHDDPEFHVYTCPECSNETMIENAGAADGYRCVFCGNEESDEIEVRCGVCSMPWARGFMQRIDWHGDGEPIYTCPRCRRDPVFVRDDD